MIKYLILFAIAGICAYIGWGYSNYYTSRSKFFKSVELLFDKLKTEIRFSQGKLIEILNDFQPHSKDTQTLINNFVDCLNFDKEINPENLFVGIKVLNDDEKNVLAIFFKSLGKFDAFNQTNQLANQQDQLAQFFKKAEEDAKKFGTLYIKLGIIAGLVIVLIFA